jgi:hypothetical protein
MWFSDTDPVRCVSTAVELVGVLCGESRLLARTATSFTNGHAAEGSCVNAVLSSMCLFNLKEGKPLIHIASDRLDDFP